MSNIALDDALEALWDAIDPPPSMHEIKRAYLRVAIKKCDGDVSKAARLVRFGRSSIYRTFQLPVAARRRLNFER